MVGHQLELPDLNHGIELVDLAYLALNHLLSEGRIGEVGPLGGAARGFHISYHLSEHAPALVCHHGDQIGADGGVVMTEHAPGLAVIGGMEVWGRGGGGHIGTGGWGDDDGVIREGDDGDNLRGERLRKQKRRLQTAAMLPLQLLCWRQLGLLLLAYLQQLCGWGFCCWRNGGWGSCCWCASGCVRLGLLMGASVVGVFSPRPSAGS